MRSKKIGKCHICGEEKILSYEHVPPAKAFNDASTKVYKGIDLMKAGGLPWDMQNIRGTILQRGSGGYTLCIKCNSFTGAKYAKDFISACKQAMDGKNVEIRKDIMRARVQLHDINPLNFIKQVLSMFASINNSNFLDSQPALKRLILDENAVGINSDKYGLFMYLSDGGLGRQTGWSVLMRKNGMMICLSELTTMPFGFVLIKDPVRRHLTDCGTDITEILNDYQAGEVGKLHFELPIYTQNSPLPLDFRSKETITEQIKLNTKGTS